MTRWQLCAKSGRLRNSAGTLGLLPGWKETCWSGQRDVVSLFESCVSMGFEVVCEVLFQAVQPHTRCWARDNRFVKFPSKPVQGPGFNSKMCLMFGDGLHCYGCKVIHPPHNSLFWTERGKMGHYVTDSLGIEKNSGQNCLDGGQLKSNDGQRLTWAPLSRCLGHPMESGGESWHTQ